MNTVTEQHLTDAVDYVNSLEGEQIDELIELFKEHQPFLMVFLLAVADAEMNQDEREDFFFIGAVMWYACYLANPQMPQVTEKVLEKIEDQNNQMIAYLEEEDDLSFTNSVELVMTSHPQKELLGFAASEIMENEDLRAEVTGMMFVHLKTMVECLEEV